MTAFYFVVATFPIAIYALALARLRGRSSPTAVSGRRDFLALCAALSGVFFIGPGQLLVSWGAADIYGGKGAWGLADALCVLVATLIALNLRSRIVVYNVGREDLKKVLTTTAAGLDDEARWSGASLNLPGLEAQFYLEYSGFGRVATIVRIGDSSSTTGWNRFAKAFVDALKNSPKVALSKAEKVKGGLVCAGFALFGLALLAADAYCFLRHREALREALEFYMSV